ncbi:MAG: hypothetical protein RI567_10595 [Marinobacter sp.]|nr:hypothetical protein [Marinobacter sp.]
MTQDCSLIFTWWNTSLAPSAKARASEEERQAACNIIRYLVEIKKSSFIALGEMSKEDAEYLKEMCVIESYEYEVGVSRSGRSSFDTCYLYDASKIAIKHISNIESQKGNSNKRIAQRVDLLVGKDLTPFHLFVSHWPSRLWCAEGDPNRHLYGIRLRDSIDDLIGEYTHPPHIMLLGDYNDDPFSDSLSQHVMATRDFKLASRKKDLFYNPFWKCLSQRQWNRGCSGSYFYKSGQVTQWHTFDQIIFSHAFLRGDSWRLTQDFEHVVQIPGVIEVIRDNDSIFDHIPVSGKIERVI